MFVVIGGARVDLVDQDGHSPLHWAALGGNADVCQILIENKINPNVQDYAGRTPLQCAAYGGYINCMVVLLENNADPNIQDKEVCCPSLGNSLSKFKITINVKVILFSGSLKHLLCRLSWKEMYPGIIFPVFTSKLLNEKIMV